MLRRILESWIFWIIVLVFLFFIFWFFLRYTHFELQDPSTDSLTDTSFSEDNNLNYDYCLPSSSSLSDKSDKPEQNHKRTGRLNKNYINTNQENTNQKKVEKEKEEKEVKDKKVEKDDQELVEFEFTPQFYCPTVPTTNTVPIIPTTNTVPIIPTTTTVPIITKSNTNTEIAKRINNQIRKFSKKMDNSPESAGEIICRQVLEKIYQEPFPKARPTFLRNPETQSNLELDGYNEKLGIAFEYNGSQHYVYPNRYHKDESELVQQLRRDQFKRDVCDRVGVYLITIPYTVPHNRIEQYIIERLPTSQTFS